MRIALVGLQIIGVAVGAEARDGVRLVEAKNGVGTDVDPVLVASVKAVVGLKMVLAAEREQALDGRWSPCTPITASALFCCSVTQTLVTVRRERDALGRQRLARGGIRPNADAFSS